MGIRLNNIGISGLIMAVSKVQKKLFLSILDDKKSKMLHKERKKLVKELAKAVGLKVS